MEKGIIMTHQQLKQATIEIRHQLEQEIETKIRALDIQSGSQEAQAFQSDYPRISQKLQDALQNHSKKQYQELTKQIAYTWFNRLCALRYMDIMHYTPIQVVSGSSNAHVPEVLWETKQGVLPQVYLQNPSVKETIQNILQGTIVSRDPDTDLYHLLLQEACQYFHGFMPFLFDSSDSLTEHIMPSHLLDTGSVLTKIQELLTEETVLYSMQETNSNTNNGANTQTNNELNNESKNGSKLNTDQTAGMVEIVGWLYQYYQTEDHDAIYDAFKKNYKAKSPDLPAATQLYTPEWIVRYMVDNSLGRLWLQHKPHSKLKEKLQYYIKPEKPETDLLPITSPTDITFCDPACGSGHILTYAFDVLYAIYEEEGYTPSEIPSLILQHNLWGMDIDQRACQLASFALVMKARSKDKRFFTKHVTESIQDSHQPMVDCPHICHLHDIPLNQEDLHILLQEWLTSFDKETVIQDLLSLAHLSNVGSLLQPQSPTEAFEELHEYLLQCKENNTISLHMQLVLPSLFTALSTLPYLSQHYGIVCTNPPYLSASKVNDDLKKFLATHYKEGKSDLCTSFILRNFDYLLPNGYNAMVTMQSWMFLSSFEDLRKKIVDEKTILTMVHLGSKAFDSFGGDVVQTTTFVISNEAKPNYKGIYIRNIEEKGEAAKNQVALEAIQNPNCSYRYTASSSDFHKIPGSPIAYWVSPRIRQIFADCEPLGSIVKSQEGIATRDNDRFLKLWFEIDLDKSVLYYIEDHHNYLHSNKWYPYNKGGNYRKWYGNHEYVINFENSGAELNGFYKSTVGNIINHLVDSISWSDITSGDISFRFYASSFLFDASGPSTTKTDVDIYMLISYSNLTLVNYLSKLLNPTLHFKIGNFLSLPYATKHFNSTTESIAKRCIELAQSDWDAYERSWNFTRLPLLLPEYQRDTIEETYKAVRWHWHEMTCEMHKLEVQNNKLFNEAYGLEDDISSEVPMQEITLTCNPAYRYPDTRSSQRSTEEKEALLLEDTMKEYISYFVGCLFGRYSLDKDGLVLANQGDTLQNYLDVIPNPTFTPDENNVVPILDEYWFQDDIVDRFYEFTKVAFSKEHINTNINYIENVLKKSIRQYFIKDFYKDHVQTYKKRPIYWLFSSEKGAFQALIYMHRYTKDTPSIVLRYLRDYISKLNKKIEELQKREIDASISAAEQNKAKKQIEQLQKTLKELHTYEKDVLYPLATKRIEIDLDDGVKHNYPLLGKALKKITGLSE